jgi:hypothetical protein
LPDRGTQVIPEKAEAYSEALCSVVSRLNALNIEKDRALKEAQKITESIYDLVRHPNAMQQTSIFTPDVAKLIFQSEKPTHAQHYATHKLLADDPTHFAPDPMRNMDTASFLVRAQGDVLLLQRVSSWIRDDSEVLQEFLDKCRKIIKISRSLPSPVPPTRLQNKIPQELWFNRRDRRIIEYIKAFVIGRRGFIPDELLSLTPMLIKRLGSQSECSKADADRNRCLATL